MRRHYHHTEVDKSLADDVVIDDVVPYSIEYCGYSATCQIAKYLLREYSAQRFYVDKVYRLGYDSN